LLFFFPHLLGEIDWTFVVPKKREREKRGLTNCTWHLMGWAVAREWKWEERKHGMENWEEANMRRNECPEDINIFDNF
jgi:hypothetical protein